MQTIDLAQILSNGKHCAIVDTNAKQAGVPLHTSESERL